MSQVYITNANLNQISKSLRSKKIYRNMMMQIIEGNKAIITEFVNSSNNRYAYENEDSHKTVLDLHYWNQLVSIVLEDVINNSDNIWPIKEL